LAIRVAGLREELDFILHAHLRVIVDVMEAFNDLFLELVDEHFTPYVSIFVECRI